MGAEVRRFIAEELLTISEAAAFLGISLSAAEQRALRQRWEYVMKGRQKLYHRADIQAMESARRAANPGRTERASCPPQVYP